jgi:hypothetical protein
MATATTSRLAALLTGEAHAFCAGLNLYEQLHRDGYRPSETPAEFAAENAVMGPSDYQPLGSDKYLVGGCLVEKSQGRWVVRKATSARPTFGATAPR